MLDDQKIVACVNALKPHTTLSEQFLEKAIRDLPETYQASVHLALLPNISDRKLRNADFVYNGLIGGVTGLAGLGFGVSLIFQLNQDSNSAALNFILGIIFSAGFLTISALNLKKAFRSSAPDNEGRARLAMDILMQQADSIDYPTSTTGAVVRIPEQR